MIQFPFVVVVVGLVVVVVANTMEIVRAALSFDWIKHEWETERNESKSKQDEREDREKK